MSFTYRARTASGEIRSGVLPCDTAEAAATQLRRDGLFPVAMEPLSADAAAGAGGDGPPPLFSRVRTGEVVQFAIQLSVMTDAGVPLSPALAGLAQQSENPALVVVLRDLAAGVEAGEDFSTGLARHPKLFDATFLNLVRAGESSGTLALMLERTADRLEREQETRRRVTGAMVYPAAMLTLCVGACVFLLAFIFPKITPLFEGRDIELPLATKLLVAISGSFTGHWPYYAAGLGVAAVGFALLRAKGWGRAAWDETLLRLPVVGPLARRVSLSRSLRTLAVTVNAGVPMLDALRLCGDVAGNAAFRRGWRRAADQVVAGVPIHAALRGNPLFPASVLQMIASGEETGRLGPVLDKLGGHFEKEVSDATANALRMLEPLMTVVMGGVIGTIAMAMLLPIFKLSSGVG